MKEVNLNKCIQEDGWLSQIMGKQVYRVSAANDSLDEVISLLDKLKGNESFLYTKIDVHDISLIECLENMGFRLVDTNIVFQKTLGLQPKNQKRNVCVRYAQSSDKEAIMKLARNNFSFSRFHLDSKIDNNIANVIKEKWVESFFLGLRGDFMLVAELNGAVKGFAQLIVSDNDIVIDLIGVDQSVQRKGVGSAMLDFIQIIDPKVISIKVGTQLTNRSSICLYEKSGFRYFDSKYVLHCHVMGEE